jgi:hypothetical protein
MNFASAGPGRQNLFGEYPDVKLWTMPGLRMVLEIPFQGNNSEQNPQLNSKTSESEKFTTFPVSEQLGGKLGFCGSAMAQYRFRR